MFDDRETKYLLQQLGLAQNLDGILLDKVLK